MEIETKSITNDSMDLKMDICDENSIPKEMGTTILYKDKLIPLFCVSNFSIEDTDGNPITLSTIAKSRETIEMDAYLCGSVQYPFPSKEQLVISPLFVTDHSEVIQAKGQSSRRKAVIVSEKERVNCQKQAEKALLSVELPLTSSNTVCVLSFGEIKPHPKYYSATNLYPIGYCSKKTYISIYDLKERINYMNEIVDGGDNGPIFRVTADVNNGEVFEGTSASGVWKMILQRVSDLRQSEGSAPSSTSVSGPEMFGISNPLIGSLLEGLKGSELCEGYVFREYRNKGRIPQGDGANDTYSDEEDFSAEEEEEEVIETESSEEEENTDTIAKHFERRSRRANKQTDEDFVSTKKERLESHTELYSIANVGNDTHMRVCCKKTNGEYEVVEVIDGETIEITYTASGTVRETNRTKKSTKGRQKQQKKIYERRKRERELGNVPIKKGRKIELISDSQLEAINMNGDYKTEFCIVGEKDGRVSVKATNSEIWMYAGYRSVLGKFVPVMQSDFKTGNYGHLLQLLYSIRSAHLTATNAMNSDLIPFLDVLQESHSFLAEEASIAKYIAQKVPLKTMQKLFIEEVVSKRSKKGPVKEISMMDDTTLYESPSIEEKSLQSVSIRLHIHSWGIKYHPKECFFYVLGENSAFILRSSRLLIVPSPQYYPFFRMEVLHYEISRYVYLACMELLKQEKDVSYIAVLDWVWSCNINDDIVITEEDMVKEYPYLLREMKDLDRVRQTPLNPNNLSNNNFMDTLRSLHETWRRATKKSVLYNLQNELEIAVSRSKTLLSDKSIEEMIEANKLPNLGSGEYPILNCVEDIQGIEMKRLMIVWDFVRQYADFLNAPKGTRITLSRPFLSSTAYIPLEYTSNVYHILIKYLIKEEVKKKNTTERKILSSIMWYKGFYDCIRYADCCDETNYQTFIRNYFIKKLFCFDDTIDIWSLIQLIVIQLIRHPDSALFRHPVDEAIHNVPGYYDAIKHPMDFDTICHRIVDGWYTEEKGDANSSDDTRGENVVGVVKDIFLIYSNCRLYNNSDSSIYRCCKRLVSLTEALLKVLIIPHCPEVSNYLINPSAELKEENAEKKEKRSSSRNMVLNQQELNEVTEFVKELEMTDISTKPLSAQSVLLYAIYRIVIHTDSFQEERSRRYNTYSSLLMEEEGILTQKQDLELYYVHQEVPLRNAFIKAISGNRELSETMKKKMLFTTFDYNPNSRVPSETALAAFIKKRDAVMLDINKRCDEIHEQVLEASQSACEVAPLGRDRKNREYWFFPEDRPSRIWVYDGEKEAWSYIWAIEDVDRLIQWIDNRGKNEHILYSALLQIYPLVEHLMKETLLTTATVKEHSLSNMKERKMKELAKNEFILVSRENEASSLYQVDEVSIGVPVLSDMALMQRKLIKNGVISDCLFNICCAVFIDQFVKEDADRVKMQEVNKQILQIVNKDNCTCEEYKALCLTVEELLCSSLQPSYIRVDWPLTRGFWQDRILSCNCISDINYFARDLEQNCIDIVVVEALTATCTRDDFVSNMEKIKMKCPFLPEVNQYVVFQKEGYQNSIRNFRECNELNGVVTINETPIDSDCLCRVKKVSFFIGRGNPHIRASLAPSDSTAIRTLVNSYYASQSRPMITIQYQEKPPVEEQSEFEVVLWMENIDSDFLVPVDKYCCAFANNLHVGDVLKALCDEEDSFTVKKKEGATSGKKKAPSGENNYRYGRVKAIEAKKEGFFPWKAITVEWSEPENGENQTRINPWECEGVLKDMPVKSETPRDGSTMKANYNRGLDSHKLGEEELKVIRAKAKEVAKNHTKEDGEAFYKFIQNYWASRGYGVVPPIVNYDVLDLGLLWKLVQLYGGYEYVVCTKGSWLDMYRLFPTYREQNTSAPTSIHKVYLKNLYQYEKEQREQHGMPPICPPRLPLPLTPYKIGKTRGRRRGREEEEEEVENELIDDEEEKASNAPLGIRFLMKMRTGEEKRRTINYLKIRALSQVLQLQPESISTRNETHTDDAFNGISRGYLSVLKNENELIYAFTSSLKPIINYYL